MSELQKLNLNGMCRFNKEFCLYIKGTRRSRLILFAKKIFNYRSKECQILIIKI